MLLVLPMVTTIMSSVLQKMNLSSSVILLCLSYILSCFIIVAIMSTKYILEEDRLIISCMGMKRTIMYSEMEQVSIGNGHLTVEASSIPQVCIIKNNKTVVRVSPVNCQEFIYLLDQKRNAIVEGKR